MYHIHTNVEGSRWILGMTKFLLCSSTCFERNCVFIVKRIEPIVGRVMLPHYTASSNKEATLYLVSADVRWRKMLPCFQSLVEIVIFQFESTNHQFCNILLWFLSNPAPSMQINNQIFAPALPHKCCILHWFCPLVACVSQNSPFLDCIIEGSSYWKKPIISKADSYECTWNQSCCCLTYCIPLQTNVQTSRRKALGLWPRLIDESQSQNHCFLRVLMKTTIN